jgi:hypothetical protein
MKKKGIRAITLAKETLRRLQPADLETAAGGRTTVSDCPLHCQSAGGSNPPCGGGGCTL